MGDLSVIVAAGWVEDARRVGARVLEAMRGEACAQSVSMEALAAQEAPATEADVHVVFLVLAGDHADLAEAVAVGESYRRRCPSSGLLLVASAFDDAVAAAARRLGVDVALRSHSAGTLADAIEAARRSGVERLHHERVLAFEAGEREVLERVARGEPLPQVLEAIVLLIERQSVGMRCTVLLVEDGTVRNGAAPSIPPEFIAGIEGEPVGPTAGSCGAAAYLRKPVVVEDIATHPYWELYREAALAHGLRACWSTPILSGTGDVLGTFAMYYSEPRGPVGDETRWVAAATHLTTVAIMRDRAERERAESDARYRRLLDTANEGIWQLDLEGNTVFVNARMAALLGRPPSEVMGTHVLEWVFEDQRAAARAYLARRHPGRSEQHDFWFRRADGTPFCAIVNANPVRDAAGKVVGTLGMITDITDRKRAERALERRESELRTVFGSAPLGIAMVDRRGCPTKCNRAFEALVGPSASAIAHVALDDLRHASAGGDVAACLRSLLDGDRDSYRIETKYAAPDGRAVDAVEIASLVRREDGEPSFAIIMVEDMSAERAMKRTMREAEQVFAAAYESTSDAMFLLAVEPGERFRFVAANRSFVEAMGLSRESVVGKRIEEVVPRPLLELELQKYREALALGQSVRWVRVAELATGTRHGEIVLTPVLDEEGRPTHLVGAVRDVTDRLEAQGRITAQAALLDRARDAIVLLGLDDEVRYWNQGAARLYGIPADEAVGRSFHDLVPSEPSRGADEAAESPETYERSRELVQRSRAGDRLVVDSSSTLLADDEGRPSAVLVINTDVTEKRVLEAKFLQAQRLESLGTLAGGIAHDFNNILTGIIGQARIATMSDPQGTGARHDGGRAREALVEIERAAWRAADLVRSILAFSRRQEPAISKTPLVPVVEEASKLLRATLPAKIEIRSRFAPGLPDVLADPTQIHQVVMNLGTNAVHAMGERGGSIELGAESVRFQKTRVFPSGSLEPGDYVLLSVADTGAGMDARTIERAFEPFFTTKAPGQGTGLGLSVVHGLMRAHRGAVDVQSEVGGGTTFRLYFPAATECDEPAAAEFGPTRGAGERILFVDDESSIAALAKEGMTALGYHVHVATDAAGAIAAIAKEPTGFDVLVTDLDMPGIDGLELARRVRMVRGDLPVVMMSGNAQPAALAAAERLGVADVLVKPVTFERIAHAVRSTLDLPRG